jgi:hypothetical protein
MSIYTKNLTFFCVLFPVIFFLNLVSSESQLLAGEVETRENKISLVEHSVPKSKYFSTQEDKLLRSSETSSFTATEYSSNLILRVESTASGGVTGSKSQEGSRYQEDLLSVRDYQLEIFPIQGPEFSLWEDNLLNLHQEISLGNTGFSSYEDDPLLNSPELVAQAERDGLVDNGTSVPLVGNATSEGSKGGEVSNVHPNSADSDLFAQGSKQFEPLPEETSPTQEEDQNQPQVLPLEDLFLIPNPLPEIEQDPIMGYVEAPRMMEENEVNYRITNFVLNDVVVDHRTDWKLFSNYNFGDDRSTNLNVTGLFTLKSEVERSLSDTNVFRQVQKGQYFSLGTLQTERQVTYSRVDPFTNIGMLLQMSFTGDCGVLNLSVPEGSQCTFTPAIVSEYDNLDDPLVTFPDRILQKGKVGDIVSPAELEKIKQPGFQNKLENGGVIGIDLFFPRIENFKAGNTQQENTEFKRQENIANTEAPGFYRVKQILGSNSEQMVLSRTIRGTNFIIDDENFGTNMLVQGATELIPDADFSPQGTNLPPNRNINPNLFKSADLARLPGNSLTSYFGGFSSSSIISEENRDPQANFNGLWIGLSPVTTYKLERLSLFESIGPFRRFAYGGGEGGFDDPVTFNSLINNFKLSTSSIANYYVQVYMTFFQRDVEGVFAQRLNEETEYVPHISFTGNIADAQNLFRYYAGVIPYSDTGTKAYLGADYTFTENGWSLGASAIGYINPTRDYYSQITAFANKNIPFGSNTSMDLFTNLVYALDRPDNIGIFAIEDYVNNVNVGAQFNLDFASIGISYNFDEILPDSDQSQLVLSGKLAFGSDVFLSGFYTLDSERSTTALYGVNALVALSKGRVPTWLSFNWYHNQYDLGNDVFGSPLQTQDEVFSILLRMEGF